MSKVKRACGNLIVLRRRYSRCPTLVEVHDNISPYWIVEDYTHFHSHNPALYSTLYNNNNNQAGVWPASVDQTTVWLVLVKQA